MNTPPTEAIRVPADRLRRFVVELMTTAGLEAEKAALLADLLVANDLRGVFSHGTRQAATYAGLVADGQLNGQPAVTQQANAGEATATFDGDGGLGYFPAYEAAHWVIAPARRYGVAAALTRNHGHFGAAGLYSRIVVAAGLIAYVTSGHQLHLQAGQSVRQAAGGSPMSFGIPAGQESPLLLDFGAMHDLYDGATAAAVLPLAPSLVVRSVGLGMVCQALGGFLAGVPVEEERAIKQYPGANQGALIIALDPAKFLPEAQLAAEMDRYHALVHELTPLSPSLPAVLPGTLEHRREREYATDGIPVGKGHQEALESAARRFGIQTPFSAP